MRQSDLRAFTLSEGLVDLIDFSLLASVATFDLKIGDDSEVMELVVTTIRDLLQDGLVVVGDLDEESAPPLRVRSWNMNATKTVARFETECVRLGRWPEMNEVCWLELTDAGREVGRQQAQKDDRAGGDEVGPAGA